jgi:glycosyltransferase involved in cell wall biosynthesis
MPSVCLCIPARDEVLEIGPALDSWLVQDYPHLRILVVDDGSTDGTSELLETRAAAHPQRLRVIRNDSLPEGWLGKNHALHLASGQPEARTSEWLLFVDADVRTTPDLLRRVMTFLDGLPTDLLTLIAAVETNSPAERIFIPLAFVQFLWFTPPSRVANPHSFFFCGTGGFTILRRKVYDAIGGHAGAPLEAIDDMRLAQRVKQAGFLNRMVQGGPELRLRMYHGLAEILRAMRKNVLGVSYVWTLAPLMILLILTLYLSPILLVLGGWPKAGLALWVLLPVMVGDAYQRLTGNPMDWIWIFWPLAGLMAAGGMCWAFLDRLRGVNHWRGRDVKVRTFTPRTS